MISSAVGFATTHAFLETKKGGIFLVNLIPLVTSFICMTLSTNVVCTNMCADLSSPEQSLISTTALIAYRILRSQLAIRKFRDSSQISHVYSAFVRLAHSPLSYRSLRSCTTDYPLGVSRNIFVCTSCVGRGLPIKLKWPVHHPWYREVCLSALSQTKNTEPAFL